MNPLRSPDTAVRAPATTAEARAEATVRRMTVDDLDAVMAIEKTAYAHPWSRGNFLDTLSAGHQALLLEAGGTLIGYYVAMKGVDEVHLLNVTVAPALQGQGWGRCLLDWLHLWARGEGAQCVWLEVRESNEVAQRVYAHCGYRRVGLRRDYYPAGRGQREHAIVMSCPL